MRGFSEFERDLDKAFGQGFILGLLVSGAIAIILLVLISIF